MALLKSIVEIKDVTAPSIPGYPTWAVTALPFEADIASIYPEDMVAYVSPGRGAITASPLQERDSCSLNRIWSAQTTGTVLAQDTPTLDGLPRWDFNGVDNGVYGTLDAPLVNYTIAMLIKTPTVVGIKGLFNVGTTSGTRLYAYQTADDIALQHGTGDIKTSTGSTFVVDAWTPIIISYNNTGKALRIYSASTTPIVTATMTNSPPSDVVAAIGSLRAGGAPFDGDIALTAVWARALHDTPTALATLVNALNGIKAL